MTKNPQSIIRITYLYLTAFIGLIIMVVGMRDLIDFLLSVIVPNQQPTTGEYRYFGELRNGLASLIVGFPVWFYHWKIIRSDKETSSTENS